MKEVFEVIENWVMKCLVIFEIWLKVITIVIESKRLQSVEWFIEQQGGMALITGNAIEWRDWSRNYLEYAHGIELEEYWQVKVSDYRRSEQRAQ